MTTEIKRAGLLLVVVAAGVVLGLALPASGPASSSRCAAHGSTTLRENSQVRVFRLPAHGKRRNFDVFACSKATGAGTVLGNVGAGVYPFLGPAIALNGPVVGNAKEQCDSDFCATSIAATDMSDPHPTQSNLNGSYGAPKPHHLVKIGSVRVAKSGTLIWIACPHTKRSKVDGSSEPSCTRPGHRDTVWLHVQGGPQFRRLDRGRTIDPSSLRLEHGRLSWIHGHHRRHAALPGH
jgi:hypothetical protein